VVVVRTRLTAYSTVKEAIEVMSIPDELELRFAGIKLLAADVDGVLTDSGMYYSEHGDELKKFNTRDGKGIELLRENGVRVVFVTSESTQLVKRRARKLGIDALYQGVRDKAAVIEQLIVKYGISRGEIAYIGDDVNDLAALRTVGVAITVADGLLENRRMADYVTQARGGEGAVREVATLILTAKANAASSASALKHNGAPPR
jgi:YrbI family 3-deoxy-D-manno-octulosonate 8-phosphate phosphatase